MIRKLFAVSMVFCLVIILAGCATIIHGKMQQVSVATTPSGALVKATDGQQILTPGILTLDRSVPAHVLYIEKDGYEPLNVTLKRGLDGWLLGNIIVGGIIGIVVDFASGSCYAIYPDQVNTVLKAQGPMGDVYSHDSMSTAQTYSSVSDKTDINVLIKKENNKSSELSAEIAELEDSLRDGSITPNEFVAKKKLLLKGR